MIGNFRPIIKLIKQKKAKLHIFERIDKQENNIIPINKLDEYINNFDTVLITGTTLITKP